MSNFLSRISAFAVQTTHDPISVAVLTTFIALYSGLQIAEGIAEAT